MNARVAVILTVLNEAHTVGPLLDSLAAQTRPPDEIVIVDGGSTDGTLEILNTYARRLPLKVLSVPGANISQGRNVAIQATNADIIACTDAGVRLTPTWLERLLAPWEQGEDPPAVAGFFLPDPHTTFELALAVTTLPLPEEIDPHRFLPSSRSVAFTRATWERVGGYPEWLDYSEDIVFDLRVRALTPGFVWAPAAVVFFRPRPHLRAFFRQYRNYAFGDGQADLWRLRHAVRYGTYLIALPLLLWGGFALHPGVWMGLLLGGIAYCRRPWWRLGRTNVEGGRWQHVMAALWVPVLRVVGDVAKMVGYPQGLWWRYRHRHDPRIHWRADLPHRVGGSSGGRII